MTAGIYRIRHKTTGHVYIGCAQDIHKRWESHRAMLRSGNHHCAALQLAWDRDGADAFAFEVIEECADKSVRRAHELDLIHSTPGTYNSAKRHDETRPSLSPEEIMAQIHPFWATAKPHDYEEIVPLWLRAIRQERKLCDLLGDTPLPMGVGHPLQDLRARVEHAERLVAEALRKAATILATP